MSQHILFVLDFYLPHKWGSETVFENIISRLLKQDYKITVITTRYHPSLEKFESNGNLEIHRVGKCRNSFVLAAIGKWIKLLRKYPEIDLIHTSTYGGAIPARILSILFKKKVFITVHEVFGTLWNTYKWRFKAFFYKSFERLIFRFKYDYYHCVSRYTMNCLRTMYAVPDQKMWVIYNGVDQDFWDPEKVGKEAIKKRRKQHGREDRFVVLYFGHSGKSKGLDYLIKAVPQIVKKDMARQDDKKILMAFNLIWAKRDGSTKHMLLEVGNLIQQLSWEHQEYIQIHSGFPKEELRTLVAAADLVVAPSLSEWFGSVHTETAAMWVPLITTNIGPLPEVLWGKWNISLRKIVRPSRRR